MDPFPVAGLGDAGTFLGAGQEGEIGAGQVVGTNFATPGSSYQRSRRLPKAPRP